MNYIINQKFLVIAITEALRTNKPVFDMMSLVTGDKAEDLYEDGFNSSIAFDLSVNILIKQLRLQAIIAAGEGRTPTYVDEDVTKLITKMSDASLHPFTVHGFIKVARQPRWYDCSFALEQREQKKK